jgi:H+/Cl- antiporter ClcA/CBS domain-containing protein
MTPILADPKVLVPQQPEQKSLSFRLTSLLNHLQPPPGILVLIYALLIGGGTGLLVVLFHYSIELIQTLSLEHIGENIVPFGSWTLACIPCAGGLIVGLIRRRYQDFFGQGISSFFSSQTTQKISPSRPVIKMLAASVSLGTGASLGPESPSVEIGANIGMLLGQVFQVSEERYRLLLGAGAAAGLAAGFNAPIAGVFFAVEVVIGTMFATSGVSLVLLSSVVSALIARIVFGVHPAFDLPDYTVCSPWEWLLYLGLGLLASLIAIAYTQAIQFAQRCFKGEVVGFTWLKLLPQTLHPVLGGLCVGVAALQLPQILSIGYGTLEAILKDGRFPLTFLTLLLVVKLIVTAICLGSGLVGGVFAPAMFIGASLGAIYGNILELLLPPGLIEIAPPPAYAMVGMAAVLAASVKAPLTAILLLFELTQNYLIILPLMAAVGVSVCVVEQIKSTQSVQELKPQQMGIDLGKPDELEILQQVPISTMMQETYLALSNTMPVLEGALAMLNRNSRGALILDKAEQLVGIVTLTDIKRLMLEAETESSSNDWVDQILGEVCTEEILFVYEDEPVTKALERMATRDLFQLPVVERDNPRKVVGVIEKEQIALAGNTAMMREALRPYLDQFYQPEKPSSSKAEV